MLISSKRNPYKDPVPNLKFTKKIHYKLNNIIPLNIYQTWHSLELPPYMKKNVNLLKQNNSEFKHYLYDDNMCREFIKNNFDLDILNAYDILKPGAFKADLWRCCILYIYGGIYLDIKYGCFADFKLINLTKQEYYVRDFPTNEKPGIYQALMINLPNNEILLNSIKLIVKNVNNRFYGNSPLDITGPQMMNTFFDINEIQSFKLSLKHSGIYYKNKLILIPYTQYREEQQTYQVTEYYYDLWKKKDIYSSLLEEKKNSDV